jgi:hypothetical protein
MIPDQTTLTYTGTWKSTFFKDANQVVNEVSTALANDQLPVRFSTTDAGFFNSALESPFKVTLTIQVDNGLGFGSVNDIIALIRHEVYQVTGSFPTSDTLPYSQQPGQGTVATGQPAPPAGAGAPQGCLSGTSNDATGSFSLSCWFSNLTQKGLASVGFLTILAIAGIGLFLYVDSKKNAATALL